MKAESAPQDKEKKVKEGRSIGAGNAEAEIRQAHCGNPHKASAGGGGGWEKDIASMG